MKRGLPESGTYTTFKKAVLEHCFPVPPLRSMWSCRLGAVVATESGWSLDERIVFRVIGHMMIGGRVVLQIDDTPARMVDQDEWLAMDPKPIRPKGNLFDSLYTTEYRIFGTETGRLRCQGSNLSSLPRV